MSLKVYDDYRPDSWIIDGKIKSGAHLELIKFGFNNPSHCIIVKHLDAKSDEQIVIATDNYLLRRGEQLVKSYDSGKGRIIKGVVVWDTKNKYPIGETDRITLELDELGKQHCKIKIIAPVKRGIDALVVISAERVNTIYKNKLAKLNCIII